MKRSVGAAFLAAVVMTIGTAAAKADGYPPFYGYSGYFGGPSTYYSGDDVHQATTSTEDSRGFGYVTYTPGGPFWTYAPSRKRVSTRSRAGTRRAAALRRRG